MTKELDAIGKIKELHLQMYVLIDRALEAIEIIKRRKCFSRGLMNVTEDEYEILRDIFGEALKNDK